MSMPVIASLCESSFCACPEEQKADRSGRWSRSWVRLLDEDGGGGWTRPGVCPDLDDLDGDRAGGAVGRLIGGRITNRGSATLICRAKPAPLMESS
jgi:hypothetical protein